MTESEKQEMIYAFQRYPELSVLIKNYKEIADVLSTLINQRQDSTEMKQSTPIVAEQPTSNLDELKKLKELLDMGIISQEEFDVKKKQLLGL